MVAKANTLLRTTPNFHVSFGTSPHLSYGISHHITIQNHIPSRPIYKEAFSKYSSVDLTSGSCKIFILVLLWLSSCHFGRPKIVR
jgi:hypothetical protein